MANTTAIKRRITSVRNTRQITKAMELVAASKMRRAQEAALRSRAYRILARQLLTRLRQLTDVNRHPLYNKRRVKSRLLVVITSDRGLAGAYNSNILRRFAAELQHDLTTGVQTKLVLIGKQGARFAARLNGVDVMGVYEGFPEHPTANDIRPVLESLMSTFSARKVDAVDILYTDYKSSISQEVALERLLPAAFVEMEGPRELDDAIFEPSPEAVLDNVTERLIEAQLTQDILESLASEQSMRMMAMKNASDNANELIDDLTLAFNSARQAAITQELAEITGGAEAIR